MDPLSITTGVASLVATCVKVGLGLKQLRDGSQLAEAKLKGLLAEVECFTKLLQHMSETIKRIDVQSELQETGHVGNHWKSISVCINDGMELLERLQKVVHSVGKSSRLLDGVRKHLRLQSASDEVCMYQGQIRSCRDTIQISLQTIILYDELTFYTWLSYPNNANTIIAGIKCLSTGPRIPSRQALTT